MNAVLRLKSIIVFLCLSIFSSSSFAYEQATHADLSEAAHAASVLNNQIFLDTLGIALGDHFDVLHADNSIPKLNDGTALGWIREGAVSEDDGVRPGNHFFNPLTGEGLGGIFLSSPDWALGDKRVATQQFSYRDARQYLYDALTARSQDQREQNFGKTFQALGQVIHHIQDMAQPQHVRVDYHCDETFPCKYPGGLFGNYYNPSLYEKYTDRNRDSILASVGTYGSVTFDTARKFWTGDGKGIAEFTNGNFVSAGTNFDTNFFPAPSPLPLPPNSIPVQQLLAEEPGYSCGGPNPSTGCQLTGDVIFYATSIQDRYANTTGINNRASTLSIFDQDLKQYNVVDPVTATPKSAFTLNRFNFQAGYSYLLPKAISYSAGLIDYFFRGKLETKDAEFTDDGIRLKLKNAIDPQTTPAWANENLVATNSNGDATKLVVAYEYKDSNGQKHYGASQPTLLSESIAPGQVSSAVYTAPVTTPIPQGSTDVKYRVVTRGKLGQEEDAVAVGIADPVSGFLVTPSYTPADGVNGPRMLYKLNGQWLTDTKPNRQAGNIDWKGWYENGKPTQVLTWRGPSRRYFAEQKSFDLGQWHYRSDIGNQVFKNGEVFAVAPSPVLGAAITKDVDGEWLVVICTNGSVDVAYRRPNEKSDSAALYDATTNPKGWVEIGETVYANTEAVVPWFFNASGTEAQTMRPVPDAKPNKLLRLKVAIQGANARFADPIDNGKGIRTVTDYKAETENWPPQPGDPSCVVGAKGTGTLTDTTTITQSGEYTIAVDYNIDQEETAKVVADGKDEAVTSGTYDWQIGGCGATDGTGFREKHADSNQHRSVKLTLVGDMVPPGLEIKKDVMDLDGTIDITDSSPTGSANSTGTLVRDDTYYMDLRHGVYVANQLDSENAILNQTYSSDGTVCNDYRQTIVYRDRLYSKSSWTPKNESSQSYSNDPNPLCKINAVNIVGFPQYDTSNQTESYGYPTLSFAVGPRSAAVTAGGDLFFSGKVDGTSTFLNYLGGIDPGQTIPSAPADALYQVMLLK